MKKRSLLLAAAALTIGGLSATEFADGITPLLPEGVTINYEQNKHFWGLKTLTVAGSEEGGYKAFFEAVDAEHGGELWVTDGTPAGTKLVKDINPGVNTSNVSYLTRFNDKVVFSADDGENGQELWISDGTEAGTYMVADIHVLESSNPQGFCQIDETRFTFFATDLDSETFSESGSQQWLWISDGTEEGTQLVAQADCYFPGREEVSRWQTPCRVGRKVFFKADVADKSQYTYGDELWVTDGTEAGTFRVSEINLEPKFGEDGTTQIGTIGPCVLYMQNYYNKGVTFRAWSQECGNEVWFSDGTVEGTYQIADVMPGAGPSGIGHGCDPSSFGEIYNGYVMCRGREEGTGFELLAINPETRDYKVYDIFSEAPSVDHKSFPDDGVVFDGRYMFCAATGFDANNPNHHGGELHWFDGTQVQMQMDWAPGTGCDWIKEMVVCGGSLYWWNEGSLNGTGATNTKLIRLDKWDGTPEIVSNIDAEGDKVFGLRNLNGELLFSSAVNSQLYCCHYRQPGYDPTKNPDSKYMVIDFGGGSGKVEDVKAEKVSVSVYPNPATESFKVNGATGDVKVYDLSGRLVLSTTAKFNQAISVEGLAAGFYKVVVAGKSATLIVK